MNKIVNEKFIVVGYYTKDTPYEMESRNLKAWLNHWHLDFEIVGVNNRGSWQRNTQYKAEFIRDMLDKYHPLPIVYLDVDAVVDFYPSLFHYIKEDFAAHYKYYEPDHCHGELLSGTLFFRNNLRARDLIARWIKCNEENPRYLEQKNLQASVKKWMQWSKEKGRLFRLPWTYCCIFDDPAFQKQMGHVPGDPFNPIVITHTQASRKWRDHETVRT